MRATGALIPGFALFLLLAGCSGGGSSTAPTPHPTEPLVAGEGLEQLHRAWDPIPGQTRWDTTIKRDVSLEGFIFFRRNGRLSASENCNAFQGSYDATPNGDLRSGPLDMMLGSGCGSENNYVLMEITKSARRWQVQGDRLTLFDGAGKPLATFVPDATIVPA